MKKSEVINTKTPLSKTTINLKPDNQEAEKIKDDRMYRTLKSNTKDLKKVKLKIIKFKFNILDKYRQKYC
jgi:hypothetical protein